MKLELITENKSFSKSFSHFLGIFFALALIIILCDIALKACTVCECKDWARVDVMQNEYGEFYVLEINTVPGMTDHSLFPAAAKISGLSFNELIHEIISDA